MLTFIEINNHAHSTQSSHLMEFFKPVIYYGFWTGSNITQFFIAQRRVYENKLIGIGHSTLDEENEIFINIICLFMN